MGVGATKSMRRVRWGTARRIILTWIITIPASAAVSYCTFYLLSMIPFFSQHTNL